MAVRLAFAIAIFVRLESIIDKRCGAKPTFPIETFCGCRDGNRAGRRCAADRRLDAGDLAQATFVDDRHRFHEFIECASLLRSDLHDASGLFLNLTYQLSLVDRQRERLFAIATISSHCLAESMFPIPMPRAPIRPIGVRSFLLAISSAIERICEKK